MSEGDLVFFFFAAFAAQLVDGAIGMGYGTLSSGLLLASGFPPQSISATVHMAQIFSSGASTISHYRFKNIDATLLKKLALPAMIGAALGAFLVTRISGAALKPWIAGYFVFVGIFICIKTLRPQTVRLFKIKRAVLGFIGGFLDAFGGSGWGEFVSSGLVLRGQEIRTAVGSLNAAEFLVTLTVSATFITLTEITNWPAVIAIAGGGIAAAPFGAWICKHAPAKPLTLAVGLVVAILGVKSLIL